MASFGASVSASVNVQNAAFDVFHQGALARGATLDNDLGPAGAIAAAVGSLLKDEVRVPGLTVGGGTQITQFSVYSVSLVPTSTQAARQFALTFTVTGVNTSDAVFFNPPAVSNNVVPTAVRPTAADTVELIFVQTAASSTPASGTHRFVAFRCI